MPVGDEVYVLNEFSPNNVAYGVFYTIKGMEQFLNKTNFIPRPYDCEEVRHFPEEQRFTKTYFNYREVEANFIFEYMHFAIQP